MIARGDTTGAANLVQQVRGQIQQRFGRQASPQALNQIMDDAGSRASLAQGKLNIASVDRDLKSFFLALKKMGHDAEEEMRRLQAQARHLAASRGLDSGPVLREASRLSNDFDQRQTALGTRAPGPAPTPRPVRAARAPREPSSHMDRFGGRMQLFGDYAAIGAVVGAASYTATQTIQLEKSLMTLKAISGATTAQMQELSNSITAVGQTSTYSLTEVSEAATVLAQAGYSAQQVAQVLPNISNLALASGSKITDAAPLFSSVLTIFDKGMNESSYVADVLTQALNQSKLSLEQFSLGIQYAGNIAADSGVTFEEMAATLGAVSNAGIRSGSTLGTGFRAMLQELQAPSEKFLDFLDKQGLSLQDVNVRANGLIPVLELLRDRGLDSEQALNMFDVRAASFYSAASRNLDVAEGMRSGFDENGAAAYAAAQQMDTLAAQLNRLGNSIVTLTSTAGAPFLDFLKGTFSLVADLALGLSTIPGPVAAIVAGLIVFKVGTVALAASIGPLTGLLAVFPAVLAAARTSMLTFSAASVITGSTLGALRIVVASLWATMIASPLLPLAIALGVAAAGFTLFSVNAGKAKAASEEHREAADKLGGELTDLAVGIAELDRFNDQLANSSKSLADQTKEAERRFTQYGFSLEDAEGKTRSLKEATDDLLVSMRETEMLKAEERVVALEDEGASLQQRAQREIPGAIRSSGVLGRSEGRALGLEQRADYQRIASGDATLADILSFRGAAARMGTNTQDEGLKKDLEELVDAINASGIPALMSLNGNSTRANDNLLRQSRVTSSDAFAGFEQYMSNTGTNNIGPLLDTTTGQLRAPYQNDFDRTTIPTLSRKLEETITKIIAEVPELIGQETQIRLILQAEPEYASLRALRSGQNTEGPQARAAALSAAESAWKAATPAARPALEADLRTRYRRDIVREGEITNSLDIARDIDRRFALLTDSVETRQNTRSSNRALAQTTANRREEAELVAARLNTGNLTTAPGNGTFIRPIDRPEGSAFGVARPNGPHRGSDYPAGIGTQVVAPMGGMASSGYSEANGNFVRIDHGNGYESMLIHLEAAAAGLSAVAKRVEQGQEVGQSGNTGRSDGPHLHWQLKLNGVVIDPESAVGRQVIDTTAQVIQASQATFETAWGAYVAATLAEFDDRTSEMSAEDKASERAAMMERLTLEKAEMLKKNLGEVYKTLIDRYAMLADDAIARAMTAAITGEDTADLEAAAIEALQRQQDAAVRDVMASMQDGDARTVAIARIMQEFAGKFAAVGTNLLEAQFSRIEAEAEAAAQVEDLGFARRQGVIDARSNPNAQRSGSRAMDAVHSRDQENLTADLAQRDVNRAQLNYNTAKDFEAKQQTARDAAALLGDPKLLQAAETSLAEAARSSERLRISLEQAKIAYESLTAQPTVPGSPMEALGAGWAGFVAQVQNSQPMMSTLADGLMSTFEGARQGFKGLLMDVVTGSKSMGDAFKDFTMGILESLLDLATEMLAKQIIMWAIDIISGSFGGGGTKTGAGFGSKSGGFSGIGPRAYQGGLITPRRAAGGRSPSPNRDSVMTFTQPGEFIMSKTATDFIGADTLSQMNASGNRQMKQMPTLAQAMPQREKDEVNVWVVAPNQRPPTGKKDIVAAISDDIINHGQTRQLIKQLQMGGV